MASAHLLAASSSSGMLEIDSNPNPLRSLVSTPLGNIADVAQSWPDRPVKVIVPYAPGGGVDPVARLVSLKLADIWKQPVVVENKAGGSGTIGANYVAKSASDGLTILMSATAEVVINQHFMQK
eukprot:gene16282-19892_t